MSTTFPLYRVWWRMKNRLRRLMGYAAIPKACCRRGGNLVVVEQRSDITVQQCVLCGARHFTVIAEPGVLGLRS